MSIFYSASKRGFFTTATHGNRVPDDAVKISARRHRELLDAQAGGAEIMPGPNGRPTLFDRRKTREYALGAASRAVKREARSRILAVASEHRQANDNAVLALAALQLATLGDATADFLPAVERRDRIDAIRAASGLIEAELPALSVAQLRAFTADTSPHWPIFAEDPAQ